MGAVEGGMVINGCFEADVGKKYDFRRKYIEYWYEVE
jgi:hypothetical protein